MRAGGQFAHAQLSRRSRGSQLASGVRARAAAVRSRSSESLVCASQQRRRLAASQIKAPIERHVLPTVELPFLFAATCFGLNVASLLLLACNPIVRMRAAQCERQNAAAARTTRSPLRRCRRLKTRHTNGGATRRRRVYKRAAAGRFLSALSRRKHVRTRRDIVIGEE